MRARIWLTRRRRLARAVLGIALGAVCALAVAPPSGADVYSWVDDQGNTHFADSPYLVPERYRARVEVRREDPREPDAAADPSGEAAEAPDSAQVWSGPEGDGSAEPAPGSFSFNVIPSPATGADAEGAGEAGAPAEDLELDAGSLLSLLQQSGTSPRELLGMGIAAMVGFVLVAVLLMVVGTAISAVVLRKACAWAGVEPPGLGRAMLTVVVAGVVSAVPGFFANMVGFVSQDLGMAASLGGLAMLASFASQIAVYRVMLPTETVGRAVVVWILNLVLWIGITLGFVVLGLLFAFC